MTFDSNNNNYKIHNFIVTPVNNVYIFYCGSSIINLFVQGLFDFVGAQEFFGVLGDSITVTGLL